MIHVHNNNCIGIFVKFSCLGRLYYIHKLYCLYLLIDYGLPTFRERSKTTETEGYIDEHSLIIQVYLPPEALAIYADHQNIQLIAPTTDVYRYSTYQNLFWFSKA